MTTAEKIAYLKGIIAASNISDSQTKRIFDAMIEVLDSLAEDVEFNANNIDNIDSRLSEVDDDLDAVETFIFTDDLLEDYDDDAYAQEDDFADDEYADDFEEYDEYDADDFDDDEGFDVADYAAEDETDEDIAEAEDDIEAQDDDAQEDEFDALEDEEEGEEMYEIECPACHETIYLQESVILDGAVDCPNCGEPLEFDIEFEE